MVSPTKVNVPVDVELFLTINGQPIQLVSGPKPDPNKLPPVAMTPANQAAILDALRAMRGMLLMFHGVYKNLPQQREWLSWASPDVAGRIERISRGITAAGLDNEHTTRQQLDDRLTDHAVRVQAMDLSYADNLEPNVYPVAVVSPPMPPAPDGVTQYIAPAKCDGSNVYFRYCGYNEPLYTATLAKFSPLQTKGMVYYNQTTKQMWYVPDIVQGPRDETDDKGIKHRTVAVDFVRDQPAPQVEGVDWSPVKQSATPLCDGPQQDYPPGSIPVDGLDERLLALLKRVKQYSNTATQHGCRVDFAYDEAMWHGMTSLDDMTHGPTPGRIYHNSKTGKTWFIPDKPAPVTKGPTISGAQ